ncbi:unnamed protein product [Leptidea sinapis]|uniref:Uncharacterized protein n=1 Tax=Leptidea sinapis TaxID=189913 RepID=A0A5E4QWX2_9NEOP|nr:unnamed protein product [Leptidea sinapis]
MKIQTHTSLNHLTLVVYLRKQLQIQKKLMRKKSGKKVRVKIKHTNVLKGIAADQEKVSPGAPDLGPHLAVVGTAPGPAPATADDARGHGAGPTPRNASPGPAPGVITGPPRTGTGRGYRPDIGGDAQDLRRVLNWRTVKRSDYWRWRGGMPSTC